MKHGNHEHYSIETYQACVQRELNRQIFVLEVGAFAVIGVVLIAVAFWIAN